MTVYARSFLFSVLLLSAACNTPAPPFPDASLDATGNIDATSDTLEASTDGGASGRYSMPACASPRTNFAPVGTRCQHLVDTSGRVFFLQGINARIEGLFDVTFQDGRTALEPIPSFTIDDARRMRSMGFNTLRLPINWSGLEPQDTGTTTLDPAYMARLDAVIELARQAGLYVLVDLHQDAYSKEIGEDGAPRWAIEPPPTSMLGGPLIDLEARRSSAEVLAALNTLFIDTSATGMRLRARMSAALAAVAARYRTSSTVLGYETLNEPLAAEFSVRTLNEQIATAVRAQDPGHLIFFEPSTVRNFVDRSNVPTGMPFSVTGGVYSPHVYTLAFRGTDEQRMMFTRATLRSSWENAVNEATIWGTPVVVTEWGYDPNGIRAQDYLTMQTDIQDEFGIGAMFWVWKENSQGSWGIYTWDPTTMLYTERDATRRALSRVRPELVAGWPRQWSYDRALKHFTLSFTGDPTITAPHRIFVPESADFAPRFEIRCDGNLVSSTRDAATGLVDVTCGRDSATHTIEVMAVP